MSSKKQISEDDWDRNEGRFTLYFSRKDLPRLKELAGGEGSDVAGFLKMVYKDFLDGNLVRKEALEAYKEVVTKFFAGRSSGEIPTYGAAEESEQDRKVG